MLSSRAFALSPVTRCVYRRNRIGIYVPGTTTVVARKSSNKPTCFVRRNDADLSTYPRPPSRFAKPHHCVHHSTRSAAHRSGAYFASRSRRLDPPAIRILLRCKLSAMQMCVNGGSSGGDRLAKNAPLQYAAERVYWYGWGGGVRRGSARVRNKSASFVRTKHVDLLDYFIPSWLHSSPVLETNYLELDLEIGTSF